MTLDENQSFGRCSSLIVRHTACCASTFSIYIALYIGSSIVYNSLLVLWLPTTFFRKWLKDNHLGCLVDKSLLRIRTLANKSARSWIFAEYPLLVCHVYPSVRKRPSVYTCHPSPSTLLMIYRIFVLYAVFKVRIWLMFYQPFKTKIFLILNHW